MANSIGCCVYNINDFPDDILSHIISFLPFKEAVRTSILSMRWRYLYILLSNLDLEIPNDYEKWERSMSFVDRHLLWHLRCRDIPPIVRFRCHGGTDPRRIELWFFALVSFHKIRELDLSIDCEFYDIIPFPNILFTCESLEVLKLKLTMQWGPTFHFNVFYRICLPHLKVLHFEEIEFRNNGFEEKLFSSCPVLEDLVLFNCCISGKSDKFNISNQNLKTLTLDIYPKIGEGEEEEEEEGGTVSILINTPSLVFLDYSICEDFSLVALDVKSLGEAIIDIASSCAGEYVNAAPGVLRHVQDVHTLLVNYSVLRDLQCFGLTIPLFRKLTCLTIWKREYYYDYDPICLEYFLTRCVALETLIFEGSSSLLHSRDISNQQHSLQKSQLGPLLCHLKTIEIYVFDIEKAENSMAAIEFVLENALVLEELRVHSEQDHLEQKSKIMEKLMSFPKASRKCKVLL